MSVNVYYHTHFVGRLAYKNHKIYFEYSQEFLKTGLELSPFKLPLKAGVIACEDFVFDGLFGIFNDSLPDGWGRLLLDRKLIQLGINPEALMPLDRLCYVGKTGMGALSYQPEYTLGKAQLQTDLDIIEDKILQFQTQDISPYIDELLIMNGSSAGNRPKILVSLIDNSYLATGHEVLDDREDWLIKFRSSLDPLDVGPVEYAYHLMALASGLDVPEGRLFPSKKCPGYFGVKRFDRALNEPIHMHTASGLLHVDHRLPSVSYETLLKMTLWLTKDVEECKKQFRHAVFNVMAYNRDDHVKNFSFLMDSKGKWKVAPAYDLIFSSGLAGEHCTTIGGESKNPNSEHLKQLAKSLEINNSEEIIDEVSQAVSEWPKFAKEAQVTQSSMQHIQKFLHP